jgi:two-component system, NarL family, sensor histidine kinase DevS
MAAFAFGPDGRELSSAILEGMPDATVLVRVDGEIVYANQRVEELLGWPVAELVGQPVECLVPLTLAGGHHHLRDGFFCEPRNRMMGSGIELNAQHRDGRLIPVEISLSPFEYGGDHLVISAIRDASEQRALRHTVAELEAARSKVAVLEDRDRIARDLHDGVIQRLFAAGLHLQASIGRPDQADRIFGVVDDIDAAIKEIRTTIFTLHGRRGLGSGLKDALRSAASEASRLLGHEPILELAGPIASVTNGVEAEILAVVRELLSNVAKHAQATTVRLRVAVDEASVSVTVEDDGVGFDLATVYPGSGLENLRERAECLSGTMQISGHSPHGTVIRWRVPYSPTNNG